VYGLKLPVPAVNEAVIATPTFVPEPTAPDEFPLVTLPDTDALFRANGMT
jgi:hypothetical protein